ncbi:MAG TPA: MltA domain-containing protein [Burkholderiales bacterium]|nr:MltA domain-containing protein [Burkholderiales bacterium]
MINHARFLIVFSALLSGGCANRIASLGQEDCGALAGCPVCPACPATPTVAPRVNPLEAVDFAVVTGWKNGEQAAAWPALLASCQALRWREGWRGVCTKAMELRSPTDVEARRFLEEQFTPWRLANPDGSLDGLVTGYYEPVLRGSRTKLAPFVYPLYGPPDDLLTIDLSATNPELRGMRLRGRLEGKRVVPYYSRAEIARGMAPVAGKEILWVDDPIEAFFLQVQGSGRVQLRNGETLRIGYADQNGQPFQSIGRFLVDRGELKLGETSMQSIKTWAAANPQRVEDLLDQNPSFVFFRELPLADGATGPIGAQGVPLTPGRSIAVDRRYIDLGTPVFLATTYPASATPLTRLVLAQDSGGAIRNPVRADFFWGSGAEAGALAGRTRQQGRMWALLPKGMKPSSGGASTP